MFKQLDMCTNLGELLMIVLLLRQCQLFVKKSAAQMSSFSNKVNGLTLAVGWFISI